jgi:CrcB protein
VRIALIGLLGSVGALARFELSKQIHQQTDRVGLPTIVVNITGAVLLGFLLGLDSRAPIEADVLAGLAIGFLGGFTTFSTWMVDVVVLAEDGKRGRAEAAFNVAITVIGGIASYGLARLLVGSV